MEKSILKMIWEAFVKYKIIYENACKIIMTREAYKELYIEARDKLTNSVRYDDGYKLCSVYQLEIVISDNPEQEKYQFYFSFISNEIIEYNEFILSMLSDKKCIQIPTKAVSNFIIFLKNNNLSLRYEKNENYPNWTIIHNKKCNCLKK